MAKHHDMLSKRETQALQLEKDGQPAAAGDEWETILTMAKAYNEKGWQKKANLAYARCLNGMASEYWQRVHSGHKFTPMDEVGALSVADVFKK